MNIQAHQDYFSNRKSSVRFISFSFLCMLGTKIYAVPPKPIDTKKAAQAIIEETWPIRTALAAMKSKNETKDAKNRESQGSKQQQACNPAKAIKKNLTEIVKLSNRAWHCEQEDCALDLLKRARELLVKTKENFTKLAVPAPAALAQSAVQLPWPAL